MRLFCIIMFCKNLNFCTVLISTSKWRTEEKSYALQSWGDLNLKVMTRLKKKSVWVLGFRLISLKSMPIYSFHRADNSKKLSQIFEISLVNSPWDPLRISISKSDITAIGNLQKRKKIMNCRECKKHSRTFL